MKKVCIIGAGRVGTTLGILLAKNGYEIVSVSSRTISSCERFMRYVKMGKICSNNKEAAALGEIIFITTNDDSIKRVSREISGQCKGKLVIHCSGALTTDVLECEDAKLASIHPIQAVSCPEKGIKSLPGSYFDIQCKDPVYDECERIVHDIGGIPIRFSKKEKMMNHIASCMISNYSVALFNIAKEIYGLAGIKSEKADSIMLPLFEQNVNNIKKAGAIKSLTGPIERGDVETIRRHLDALDRETWIKALYVCLGRSTLKIAEKKGLDPEKADEIKKLLKSHVQE